MRKSRRQTVNMWRRKAHLVIWDDQMRMTLDPWPVYWCPEREESFALVMEQDREGNRLLLPVRELFGYYHFYTGDIAGVRILDGYGPGGVHGCRHISAVRSEWPDCWGYTYWYGLRWRPLVKIENRKEFAYC